MSEAAHGSCVCGAVAYRIEGPYRGFQYCHCSRCRKKTGAASCANLFVPVEQFTWDRGEDIVKRFELPTAKWWSTAFCTECGSAVPWLTRNGKVMVVGAGGLVMPVRPGVTACLRCVFPDPPPPGSLQSNPRASSALPP